MEKMGLSREQQQYAVDRLKEYFREEFDEGLGDLAATLFLDFLSEYLAPFWYNRGLADAQALMRRVAVAIDEDLEAAKRPPPERGIGGR